MQRSQCVRVLGLLVGLGLAGSLAGCGCGASQAPTTEDFAAGKAIRAEIREFQKKQLAGKAAAPKGGGFRRGDPRAKSGP